MDSELWVSFSSFPGTVSRTYGNNFRVKSLSVNGEAIEYGYDDDGLITKAGDMTITRDPANGLITDTALGVVDIWGQSKNSSLSFYSDPKCS